MRVCLVSPWGTACGISEYAAYLVEAVRDADPSIQHVMETSLHPDAVLNGPDVFDLVVLNYHAALTSQWHPEHIKAVQARGGKVLAVYHDSGVPNSDQAKGICAAADCAVVHEPFDDLDGNVHYIRQGVPGWSNPYIYNTDITSWCGRRPIVGTVGFPFPWKNYDLLCEASALAGWATLIIAPGATAEQQAGWFARQPHLNVHATFLRREAVASRLAGCDATAFLYSCQNAGTSGAIRQGIAARKPVLALAGCRQFRDLQNGPEAYRIWWVEQGTPEGVALVLGSLPPQRVDAGMVALAERDSWAKVGQRYAALYRGLVA